MKVKGVTVGIVAVALLVGVLSGCDTSTTDTTETEVGATEAQEVTATKAAETEETEKSALAPSAMAVNPIAPLEPDTKIVLMGSGFEPGQEVALVLYVREAGEVFRSDLTYAAEPQPVADDTGAWVTSWGDFERWVGKKLIGQGVFTISVADPTAGYKPLTSVPVAFYDSSKPQEEWPSWAKFGMAD